ncbi:unnamed protein product [Caenorhabditis angaria]|uniref:Protein quiver n=1 Tax=Caenorhabditis angaria TaxID=860376 RepID=A0A9P1N9A1_9PELO|nr:unnamed protein product [Caenorhabditis angaria]
MLRILIYSIFVTRIVDCINCFECTSSQGVECKYSAASCQYGLFGCVKIAVMSGGVDKMGMFYEQDRSIISMMRGCALIPFGGVDMCEQTSLFGTRVLKCTCFNDYCNFVNSSKLCILLFLLPIWLFIWNF